MTKSKLLRNLENLKFSKKTIMKVKFKAKLFINENKKKDDNCSVSLVIYTYLNIYIDLNIKVD